VSDVWYIIHENTFLPKAKPPVIEIEKWWRRSQKGRRALA